MTDASMNVATIESRPPPIAPDVSGRTRSALDKANEASKTEGKTFAETLKAAEDRQPEKSEKAAKSDRSRKGTHLKNPAVGKKSPKDSGTGNIAARAKTVRSRTGSKTATDGLSASALESRNQIPPIENGETVVGEDQVLQIAVAETALQSGAVNTEAGTVKAVRTQGENGKTKSVSPEGLRSESSGSRASGDADAIKNSKTDLSSVSGKVEVVDNRESSKLSESGFVGKSTSGIGKETRQSSAKARTDAAPRTESANFRLDNTAIAETEIDLSPASGKSFNSSTAAAELSKKLDTQAGNEIVRQVKVVLNRSDAGEVRINLRPDNLGRVRVRIQMEDNRLTGRIFVESAAAREAFRSAIDGLQAKLVEAGFGSADLELTWDDSSGGFSEGQQQGNGKSANTGQAAREFENMVPSTAVDETADGRVNLVV